MGIVEAKKLIFEYIRRDEEGNVEGITRAVDEVDLDVKQGDFVAVLGHNGSGKSTLAKHLNAILYPTEGTVWVDGKDTSEEKYLWEIRQTAGMVFQNPDNQIIGQVVEEDDGPDAISSALKEAKDKGVKIVYVDSPANVDAEATFSTDNKAAGKTAGEEMLKALEAKGVTSGKVGIINVNAATDSCVMREEGFRSAFEGSGFELLETQYGEGDAAKSQSIAENYITQGVVVIFGCNEGSTTGAGNAIKATGKADIVGVGFDKSDAIQGLINDGYLLATMAQNPDVMGSSGVEACVQALEGTALNGAVTDTGVSVLTK